MSLWATVERVLTVRCVLVWVAVATAGCRDEARPPDWEDLFEVRASVPLARSSAEALEKPGALNASGWPAKQSLPVRLPVSSLREGDLYRTWLRDGDPREFTRTEGHAVSLASFVPVPPAISGTPYWLSMYVPVAAVGGGRLYVAANLLYPIRVYADRGILVDSLGTPPDSWRQARKPIYGEFERDSQRALGPYFEEFTIITGLAVVGDSILLVNHGQFEREEDGRIVTRNTSLDVYRGRRRVLTGIPSPGTVIAYSDRSVFFLNGDAHRTSSWRIVEYRWKGG